MSNWTDDDYPNGSPMFWYAIILAGILAGIVLATVTGSQWSMP